VSFCVSQIVHRYDIILIQEVRDIDLSATNKLMEHVNKLDCTKQCTIQSAYVYHYDKDKQKDYFICVCVFAEVHLSSGTATSSASLWAAAPTRRDISFSTGKHTERQRQVFFCRRSFVELNRKTNYLSFKVPYLKYTSNMHSVFILIVND